MLLPGEKGSQAVMVGIGENPVRRALFEAGFLVRLSGTRGTCCVRTECRRVCSTYGGEKLAFPRECREGMA